MIIDTSALMAILLQESDAQRFADRIAEADSCKISAVTFVEASIIAESSGMDGGIRELDSFIRKAGILIEAVDAESAHTAREAYAKFGKGRHPAALNLGDCFSYALAKTSGEPLLFKGRDFAKTDISPAA